MNEQLPNCESLSEAISLLAAGCLSPDEEIEVRKHLAACSACRERFDQLDSVCAGLHAAQGDERFSGAGAAVSRAMMEIGETSTLVVGFAASKPRSIQSRWRIWVVAAIATSILAIVSWRSLPVVRSRLLDVADHNPTKVVPVPEKETRPTAKTIVASSQPTWLALQRAAARSEEAFDDLLARGNEPVRFAPLNTHTLLQETDL